MQYYVVTRYRKLIDIDYLRGILTNPSDYNKGFFGGFHGPFQTLDEAERDYQNLLLYVDDSDYGLYAIDQDGRWHRYE